MPIEWSDAPASAPASAPAARKSGVQWDDSPAQHTQMSHAKPDTPVDPRGTWSQIGTGALDPAVGLGQLAAHAAPYVPFLRQATESAGLLAGKPLLQQMETEVPKKADELVRERETAIQAERGPAAGRPDTWRTIGNMVSPANLVGVPGNTLARAALSGAVSTMAQPETGKSDDYAKTKAKEAAMGALTGPAATKAMRGVAGAISPEFRSDVAKLLSKGVKLTPGQLAGGTLKEAEDALASRPVLGSVIRGGQHESVRSFGRALANSALSNIGEKVPASVPSGHETVAHVERKLSDAYGRLLPYLRGELDPELRAKLDGVTALAQDLPADQQALLRSILKREVRDRFTPYGVTSGKSLKDMESALGEIATDYFKKRDTHYLGDAIHEAQSSIRDMVTRLNPEYGEQLAPINRGWAEFKRMQRAATSAGTKDGVFSPTQYEAAVKARDESKDRGAFARGSAFMQDVSGPARNVMPQSVPDSGTAKRLFWGSLLSSGALSGTHAPGAEYLVPSLLAAGAAAVPYSGPGMSVLRQWATPGAARQAAAAPFRAAAPYASPAAAIALRDYLMRQRAAGVQSPAPQPSVPTGP